MDGEVLGTKANRMNGGLKYHINSKKPLQWGFFIPQIGLSELCQKKTGFLEFFYFEETHETLVNKWRKEWDSNPR